MQKNRAFYYTETINDYLLQRMGVSIGHLVECHCGIPKYELSCVRRHRKFGMNSLWRAGEFALWEPKSYFVKTENSWLRSFVRSHIAVTGLVLYRYDFIDRLYSKMSGMDYSPTGQNRRDRV